MTLVTLRRKAYGLSSASTPLSTDDLSDPTADKPVVVVGDGPRSQARSSRKVSRLNTCSVWLNWKISPRFLRVELRHALIDHPSSSRSGPQELLPANAIKPPARDQVGRPPTARVAHSPPRTRYPLLRATMARRVTDTGSSAEVQT